MCKQQAKTEDQQRLSAVVRALGPIADHLSGAIEEFVRTYSYQILTEEPLDRQATGAVAEIAGLGRLLRKSIGQLTELLKVGDE